MSPIYCLPFRFLSICLYSVLHRVKLTVVKAAIEKVTQNFGVETRNDMKQTVKHVTGKRSGFVSNYSQGRGMGEG